MKVIVHVFVSRRVQGVFFRSEIACQARKLEVNGWVRNLRNGRVEAVFEGEQESITKLVDFRTTGPPAAVVENVNVVWEEYADEFRSFTVKH
jgi:acylphosphatase